MSRVHTRSKMSTRKKLAAITAFALIASLLVGGVFAWTDFSQNFINRFRGGVTPDALLHDDFEPWENKDVYVENTGEQDIFVRVKLNEFLQVGNNPVIPGTVAKDTKTWKTHLWDTTPADCALETHDYFTWILGGEKIYLPGTSEFGNETYADGEEGPNGEIAKPTLPANDIVLMADYIANKAAYDAAGGRWVLDTDGWAYWSLPLETKQATSLLLTDVDKKDPFNIDDNFYYAIDVKMNATNKTEAWKMYKDATPEAIKHILPPGLIQIGDRLFRYTGYPSVYEEMKKDGRSYAPQKFWLDDDNSIGATPETLSGDEIEITPEFMNRVKEVYPNGFTAPAAKVAIVNDITVVADEDGNVVIEAVNFPDAAFRDALLNGYVRTGYTMGDPDNSMVAADTDGDGKLSLSEIDDIIKIVINGVSAAERSNFTDLKGIELFSNLEIIIANKSQLTSIDTSKNLKIKRLSLDTNYLSSIDVSKNLLLEHLNVATNMFTELDVRNNLALTYLACGTNQISTLDVSNNLALITLSCRGNLLTTLDASNITTLEELNTYDNPLITSINASGCNALARLYAYGTASSPMNLTSIDITGTVIADNSTEFRIQYNGGINIIGAGARTFTNTTYHKNGNIAPDGTGISYDGVLVTP